MPSRRESSSRLFGTRPISTTAQAVTHCRKLLHCLSACWRERDDHRFHNGYTTWTSDTTHIWSTFGNDQSVSFTAQAGDAWIGQPIGVKLYATNGGWGAIDNVSLNFTAAPSPEPGTIVLLITGLVSLLCYAWRKRR